PNVRMSRVPVNIQGAVTEPINLDPEIKSAIELGKINLPKEIKGLQRNGGKKKRFQLAAWIANAIDEINTSLNETHKVLSILFCNSGQDRTGTTELLAIISLIKQKYANKSLDS